MALTSEELNFLVYRYLQESGECAAAVMDVPERNDTKQNACFFSPTSRGEKKKKKNGDAALVARRSFFCSAAASRGLWAPPLGASLCLVAPFHVR